MVYDIDHERLPDAVFGVLLAFQATFGPAWMHFSAGRLWLRAQAIGCEPEDCVSRMQQALRMANVPGDVSAVRLEAKDLKAWRTLIAWRESFLKAVDAPTVTQRAPRKRKTEGPEG